MATFVLVHGGYHGGWCWRDVVAELERRGHRAIAPDLPCDDPTAGYPEYATAVSAALGPVTDDEVILVGHSLGAFTVPLVSIERPVRRQVFLCSTPEPARMGLALRSPDAAEPGSEKSSEGSPDASIAVAPSTFSDGHGLRLQTPTEFLRRFYHDCEPQDAWWALAHLRPQGVRPLVDPWPLRRWPELPTTVVLAKDDRVVPLGAARAVVDRIPHAGDPVILDGGHSVFLTQPAAVVDVLDGLVSTPETGH
jgi:pimeloyl-ACP methyl ester carboxylesterase